ncbi:hypothetical protein AJ80_06183 [Polytolypa hystricis UAMH7299]|uniref:Nucleoporin Nup133/Nup155-like C-terminal domain-containing protein n=1 Tax=Polytolypa hystricis (strain UAMH7299) TaxID=1447883 RepID=A0A2B7XXX3_POLH7|nr:hypothetical protein AJ80_06183 [Polytolypa hystricis UAMH7299]
MFSNTVAPLPSIAALRNPRRRQRTSSDETVQPPKAKRQRSALRRSGNEAFDLAQNHGEHVDPFEGGPVSAISPSPDGITNSNDLPLRGPRKTEKRGDYADGAITLANNDYYTVSHLLSLPEEARDDPAVPLRYIISPSDGHCLALSHTEAIVWPYTTKSSSPSADSVLKLPLHNPPKYPDDALPLGTFLSKPTGGSPGLMVVTSTGKITLWETVSNVSILGLAKQKQTGVQGAIPGMMSGEVATDIINAEPSGIVVTLSTGRLAHVSLRDSQGKLAITVQVLQAGASRSSSLGLFGGIRNVLSGSPWKRNVTATKAGVSSQRGQRDIVTATSSGEFELWDTHWNNGSTFKTQLDARRSILQTLEQAKVAVDEGAQNSFQLLDFAFDQTESRGSRGGSEDSDTLYSIWALVAVNRQSRLSYFVVGLNLGASTATADVVYPIHIGESFTQYAPTSAPKLFVPKPGDTAFVVFSDSVVLLSLTPVSISPSSQLLMEESDGVSTPFQDPLRFREGKGYCVLGCGIEVQDKDHKYTSCVLMVRNFGLLRISSLPRPVSEEGIEETRVSAKSRLEQAIFYGSKEHNPLDFTSYSELRASQADLEIAALELSDEILRSSSKFIPTTVPSLEQQMKIRAIALHDLALYLKKHHVPLSHLTRWRLLWGAEKMAAQRAIWRVQQSYTTDDPNYQTHLSHILEQMGEKFRTKLDPTTGDSDQVRHWFVYDTWRTEFIIPWILHGMRNTDNKAPKLNCEFVEQLREANDLSLATLESAFQFRDDNIALYGLGDDLGDDVRMTTADYKDLPEFWTSFSINYTETENLLNLELNASVQCMHQMDHAAKKEEFFDPKIPQTIDTIQRNIPRHFRAFSRLHIERVQWCEAQQDKKSQDEGQALQQSRSKKRKLELYKLAAVGFLEEAMSLAESSRDMDALVELMVELQEQIRERQTSQGKLRNGQMVVDDEAEDWQRRIDKYFDMFSEAWSDAYFNRLIATSQPTRLLEMPEYQKHITPYLRKRPMYAKLSWINDVVGESDYNIAAEGLRTLALEQETDLWSKRVQLSLGKLATFAAFEKSKSEDYVSLQDQVQRYEEPLRLCTFQEMLQEHIRPATHGAIDQSAEIDFTLEVFANEIVKDRPALGEVLRKGLEKLVRRNPLEVDELIDVLTLIDPVEYDEAVDIDEVIGHEFSLALRALRVSEQATQDADYRQAMEKMIWRRCMIRDDWVSLNKTDRKGDSEVEGAVRATALFKTVANMFEVFGDTTAIRPPGSPADLLTLDDIPKSLPRTISAAQHVAMCQDLETEVELLREYVDTGRLDDWFQWIIDAVKGSLPTGNSEEQ